MASTGWLAERFEIALRTDKAEPSTLPGLPVASRFLRCHQKTEEETAGPRLVGHATQAAGRQAGSCLAVAGTLGTLNAACLAVDLAHKVVECLGPERAEGHVPVCILDKAMAMVDSTPARRSPLAPTFDLADGGWR